MLSHTAIYVKDGRISTPVVEGDLNTAKTEKAGITFRIICLYKMLSLPDQN
jgi:hypothetical protein